MKPTQMDITDTKEQSIRDRLMRMACLIW